MRVAGETGPSGITRRRPRLTNPAGVSLFFRSRCSTSPSPAASRRRGPSSETPPDREDTRTPRGPCCPRRAIVEIPQVGGAEFKIEAILKMPPASRRDREFGSAMPQGAASRRPGPSRRRTPASSSATPADRRSPMSISRRSRAGGQCSHPRRGAAHRGEGRRSLESRDVFVLEKYFPELQAKSIDLKLPLNRGNWAQSDQGRVWRVR
jgi:hypothetical protein